MKTKREIILENILEQAKAYLTELHEFAPFGSAINLDGEIKPLGVYIDEEEIDSLKMIEMLQNHILRMINDNKFIIGAIAIDITVNASGNSYNAVEVRFIENESQYKKQIKYQIKENIVMFEEIDY
ncbi:hypothetical protein VRU48_15065 [Pedobacter sp. KR3-3]|uniref:IraD/Gp25-like domain-containing protein n=1 Tax=Pedobacter albus TaxID=3113905 RepID=A0ABU7IAC6_9SPHI|nr:hypothetical protein [Pedobacter sp. KR3-3]MEE1946443.1 hypothetical protein [Pedobacter sp. KR3-3]